MKIKIVNKSNHELPSYSTVFSAGMDMRADLAEPMVLEYANEHGFMLVIIIGNMILRFKTNEALEHK